MNFYLVGGAVRDQLLNKPVRERDYVVIGETVGSMLKQGFKQVGKDFPVFLHPETHEEYALARKERKVGEGYHGFSVDADTTISLEEDLLRRDLTINAMAMDANGYIIDPYNGKQDLNDKVLKHVSDAFVEDPLRVLRVARFQAYLPEFTIHPDTLSLMREISKKPKEISSLPTERIWLEIEKASVHDRFDLFWQTLNQCGALQILNIQLSESFIPAIKGSSLSGVERILSAIWFEPHIEGLLALSPPSSIASCMKIIHSQRSSLLFENKPSAESLLTSLKRLDPFRRLERARTIINSMPDSNKDLLLELCQDLSNMDIAKVIAESHPKDRQQLIEDARLRLIQSRLSTQK